MSVDSNYSMEKLDKIIGKLGLPYQTRYNIDEVATILGIQRSQVLSLLRRRELHGMRSSPRRWSSVFADDLAEYIERINKQSSELVASSNNKNIHEVVYSPGEIGDYILPDGSRIDY